MKLSECTIGRLVIEDGKTSPHPLRIGHVVGLEMNCLNEVIPVIQFAREFDMPSTAPIGVPLCNLQPYLD